MLSKKRGGVKVTNQRVFSRIKCKIEAMFDIVDIAEKDIRCSRDALDANIIDISVEAIKLRPLQEISEEVIEQVLRRKKKVRLNFRFNDDDDESVNIFATLVRNDPSEKILVLEYLDIPVDSFVTIRDTIDRLPGK